ncbi:MAG: DUF1848 domain-containing protein [Methanobacteriota archaeon]
MTDHQCTLDGAPLIVNPNKVISEVHPVIISVSRATDIPAFYLDWFLRRYAEGYIIWKNPYRHDQRQKVLFDKTRAAVFWTKDPGALLHHLDDIDALLLHYYVQVTLNDYERDGCERCVPPLEKRIRDFQELSRRLGRERVIWRFDPLLLSDMVPLEELFRRIESLFSLLSPYCERMVFSFIDIAGYRGVIRNLRHYGLNQVREFTHEEKIATARFLQQCSITYGPLVMACSQELNLTEFGIVPGRCVDDRLFRRIASHDAEFIGWLDHRAKKDKGQRAHCTCIVAKDVGEYSTCMHQCRYCYANRLDEFVSARHHLHKQSISQGILPESIVPDS